MDYRKEYQRWCEFVTDEEMLFELKTMDEASIEDAFFRDLEFGTGGLRGTIGAGSNRMNKYTVARASQGLADYIAEYYPTNKRIAIAYDSRNKSDEFSKTAGEVFAANGIEVVIFPELMPTPCLSFAVRYYSCSAGVVVTASHNPAEYNGYKVYGPDGCQITTDAACKILSSVNKIDIFKDVKHSNFDEELANGSIHYISNDCFEAYVEAVKSQSVLFGDETNKDLTIVYSPLNGSGLKPVLRVLNESGFRNIFVVPEQEKPDGNFPTCPYPNPEIKEALELGLKYANEKDADILLATDPDCDRVGIAVKNENDEYILLSGNEVGLLLLDYICSQRISHKKMPKNPVFCKTIVTTELAERVANHYGVRTVNVLTGFKYIGEQIGFLEKNGAADSFILGFEESYGYLSGGYVRDKDAVDGSFLICEMLSFYKAKGLSLLEKLNTIFSEYGFSKNKLMSFIFNGSKGMKTIEKIMVSCRCEEKDFAGISVLQTIDYLNGIDNLPPADVVKYVLIDGSSVVLRPSGTEPKLKVYLSIFGENDEEIRRKEEMISSGIKAQICECPNM